MTMLEKFKSMLQSVTREQDRDARIAASFKHDLLSHAEDGEWDNFKARLISLSGHPEMLPLAVEVVKSALSKKDWQTGKMLSAVADRPEILAAITAEEIKALFDALLPQLLMTLCTEILQIIKDTPHLMQGVTPEAVAALATLQVKGFAAQPFANLLKIVQSRPDLMNAITLDQVRDGVDSALGVKGVARNIKTLEQMLQALSAQPEKLDAAKERIVAALPHIINGDFGDLAQVLSRTGHLTIISPEVMREKLEAQVRNHNEGFIAAVQVTGAFPVFAAAETQAVRNGIQNIVQRGMCRKYKGLFAALTQEGGRADLIPAAIAGFSVGAERLLNQDSAQAFVDAVIAVENFPAILSRLSPSSIARATEKLANGQRDGDPVFFVLLLRAISAHSALMQAVSADNIRKLAARQLEREDFSGFQKTVYAAAKYPHLTGAIEEFLNSQSAGGIPAGVLQHHAFDRSRGGM